MDKVFKAMHEAADIVELELALTPLQQAAVTNMIDERFRNLDYLLEKELKLLETVSENPFNTAARVAVNAVMISLKKELHR